MIQYNRLWKINRSEIDYHIAHWADAGYVPPADIATWPAHGDTLLHQAYLLAPFADIDYNGIYNPLMGDYPLIRGDQCIYFVFNDAGGLHHESGGQKLGLEIRGMAYAFDCPSDSALHYTLFMHYDIINRSTTIYNNVYLGVFTDIDL